MTAILLTTLFVAAGVLAITSLRESFRRYGTTAPSLRNGLRNCSESREVRVTIRELKVRPCAAVILRPHFRGREHSRVPEHAIPAAA